MVKEGIPSRNSSEYSKCITLRPIGRPICRSRGKTLRCVALLLHCIVNLRRKPQSNLFHSSPFLDAFHVGLSPKGRRRKEGTCIFVRGSDARGQEGDVSVHFSSSARKGRGRHFQAYKIFLVLIRSLISEPFGREAVGWLYPVI